MKATISKIEEMFLNKEVAYDEFNNFMGQNGYYRIDETEEKFIIDSKKDRRFTYTATDTNSCEVMIDFDIIYDNAEDEAVTAFYLKVTSVKTCI